jgi:HK97 family phage major capsid protein
MTKEQIAEVSNEMVKQVEEQIGVKIEETVKQALEGNTDLATVKSVQEASELIQEVRKEVLAIKDGVSTNGKGETLAGFIKENKEALKAVAKNQKGSMTVKANLLRAGIANNPWDLEDAGIGQLDRVLPVAYDLFPKIPVGRGSHNGVVSYVDWDQATTVSAAASVAEGAAFPESTATFAGYTMALQKIGDTLPVTEEFFEDEVAAAAELTLFLNTNVREEINRQVLYGTGTAPQIESLATRSVAYAGVASAVQDPNISDLLIKSVESITAPSGNKYRPDFALMNISDINKLMLKKDANNNYMFSRPDERISLRIIEDNNVTANECFVGDSRYARIYEMGDVELSSGYVDAQFTSDYMTLKARKRLGLLIRNANQSGFRYISDIAAAVTSIGA